MKKTKCINLLSENEEGNYWAIETIIKKDGTIRKRGYFRLATKEERRIANKKYRIKHSDKIKEKAKKHSIEHKGELNKKSLDYYYTHKNQCLSKGKEWHLFHKEECKKYNELHRLEKIEYQKKYQSEGKKKKANKKYYSKHRNQILEHNRNYRKTEKGKEISKRCFVSRKRNYGFEPLNNPLEDIECDAHHINKDEVIYLPAIIHHRISHNLKTGKNMDLINSIAYGFI